jgi:hypothetical protein
VGSGISYRDASSSVRREEKRQSADPVGHGQRVADWVEVFAPVLWEQLGTKKVPERLNCDSVWFYVTPKRKRRQPGAQVTHPTIS